MKIKGDIKLRYITDSYLMQGTSDVSMCRNRSTKHNVQEFCFVAVWVKRFRENCQRLTEICVGLGCLFHFYYYRVYSCCVTLLREIKSPFDDLAKA